MEKDVKSDSGDELLCSLSVGHYELCRDDIGDLLEAIIPIISDLRENGNEIG